MSARMARRGTDDDGVSLDSDAGMCLAFRRLAVLEVTWAGHSPMLTSGGRHVFVFNDEIYNHVDLRRELTSLGHPFRSRSGTKVLLAALLLWIRDVLLRLDGMIAFAWYDRGNRRLPLARDHAGFAPVLTFLELYRFVPERAA